MGKVRPPNPQQFGDYLLPPWPEQNLLVGTGWREVFEEGREKESGGPLGSWEGMKRGRDEKASQMGGGLGMPSGVRLISCVH